MSDSHGEYKMFEIWIDDRGHYFAPGEPIQISVTYSADKDTRLRACDASLLLYERHQSGSNRTDLEGGSNVGSDLGGFIGSAVSIVEMAQSVKDVADHIKARQSSKVQTTRWKSKTFIVDKVRVFENETLLAGESIVNDLVLVVPEDAVPTYHGNIIEHRWVIRVDADLKGRADVSDELEINVTLALATPEDNGGEPFVEGGPRPPMMRLMQLVVPRVDYVEGETITGSLVIMTEQNLIADVITAELWNGETVSDGPVDNISAQVEAKVVLARNISLKRGTEYVYDFALPVNIQGRASFYDNIKEVVWYIKGALTWDANDPDASASIDMAVSLYGLPPE